MELKVIKTRLEEIQAFRILFLRENNFQFIHNKCHTYGWADTYLFLVDGRKAGYGAIWGQNKREDRDAIFEFYLFKPFEKFSNLIFQAFHSAAGATFIECQSNDLLLSSMLYEYSQNINAEAILFEDHFQTDFDIPAVTFRKPPAENNKGDDVGGYFLEQNGEVIASGGFMLNYNLPYADIYMEVKESFRQKGFGSLIVQELKKEIYLMGRVPAARCNAGNQPSKATLLKAGLKVCGFILKGDIKKTDYTQHQKMEEKKHAVYENGTVASTTWLCDDIKIGHAISKFNKLVSFPASNKNDVVRLHFGLKGDYRFSYKQLNKSFDLIGGHHNIMYSNSFDIVIQNKTLELETFGIQFPRELFIKFTQNADEPLKRFTQNIINGNSDLLSENWGTIDLPIQQVIQQIIHCKYTGDIKKLFLLSKSIELLVLSAKACNISASKKNIFIKNKADKEKIIAVRDLINERVHCPPNLSEIAGTVGLNEYKLKRGFKEIFKTTVFGYLTEQRLHLAHQYLRDTEKTAAEISFDLGYASPQHFNNAFKKKFGITPYSVRNNP